MHLEISALWHELNMFYVDFFARTLALAYSFWGRLTVRSLTLNDKICGIFYGTWKSLKIPRTSSI